MSRSGRIKHFVRIPVIVALSCYFGVIAILNVPAVQHQVSVAVAQELQQLTGADVCIENIDLGLLNRIIIQNAEIKDRQGKELLKVSRLSAKFEILSLLKGKIRINSVQLFGLNAHLRRASAGAPGNFQFLLDAFASKDSVKPPSRVDLRINSVLIRRGQIHYDVADAPPTPGLFNMQHIAVSDLSATLSLKALTADSLHAQIRRLSFGEQSGFTLKRLSLQVTANRKGLQIHQLDIQLPHSQLNVDTLAATFERVPSSLNLRNDTHYLANISGSITPADLSMLAPGFRHFNEPVNVKLALQGRGNNASLTRFYLANDKLSFLLKGEGIVNHWNRNNELYLFGRVSQLHADRDGTAWLVHNLTGKTNLPDMAARLGNIRFEGDVSGFLNRLTTHGTLRSAAGRVQANVTMHTDTLTQKRSYSGKITTGKLNLGTVLGQEKNLGNTAFDIELNGFTYRNGQAESYIKGTILSLDYKQHEYRNIRMNGKYTPGGFDGKIAMNDVNGQVEINGQFATNQPVPDFNLQAMVKNFRPYDLHLTDKYRDTDISLNLTADFSGHSIDDMQGKISLDSVRFDAQDPDKSYFLNNLSILAGTTGSGTDKRIELKSPFLRGYIEGNYSYRTLPVSIIKTVQRYIPSLVAVNKRLPETENNFKFDLKIDSSDVFEKVLDIPFKVEMPATVSGYFDDKRTRLQIRSYFPEFIYDNAYYESGAFLCDNTEQGLECQLRLNKRLQKGSMLNLSVHTHAKDDCLEATLNWGNNTASTFSGSLKTRTRFAQSATGRNLTARVEICPSRIMLNDTIWNIHPSDLVFDKDIIEVNNFLFEHHNQYVRAHGRIGKEPGDSCIVDLSNINLRYVMDMIQFHAVQFDGMITGRVHLNHLLDRPVMYTRLQANGFSLNNALLGLGDIRGEWDEKLGGVRIHADIRENSKFFTGVTGYVSPREKGLDLHIQAGGTSLAFLQPFVNELFTDIRGRAYGKVRLFGPFSGLDLEGKVKADAGMQVNVLHTGFQAHADSVVIRPGSFVFDHVKIQDSEGHQGQADGSLHHHKLKDLAYNFQFMTDNMRVYHSEKETPDFPFYGTIYSSGKISLHGGNQGLNVDGNLRTGPRTTFTYVTTTAAEATNSQFITFADRTPRREQELIQTEVYHHLNSKEEEHPEETQQDIRLNLLVEATPDATMRIIMDPVAGDNITANGSGNIRLNFFNKGDFQMFGNYNIEEGIYKMSMQNVIRKDFTLQSGGLVSFNGDPHQANLNVQAVYTVNSASLNDLMADASSSRGNVKVNCLLNLSGNLMAPSLKFGLDLPTVSEEDRELVRSLTSTEEQLNTQIIYLLGIGKFYTYDYANNSAQTDATSSLAFSTLSGQLNNMLSQVIDSRHWNVGTNLSTGDKGWTDVEAEAILSGRLLNNRLIINGNFGYRDNPMRNSNFVGDFEAMWLLTKNGELRLKGYNETNDRFFTKSTLTTQGVGLMYKKDFTNWRELFDWILLKHRGRKRTEVQPAAQEKRQQSK